MRFFHLRDERGSSILESVMITAILSGSFFSVFAPPGVSQVGAAAEATSKPTEAEIKKLCDSEIRLAIKNGSGISSTNTVPNLSTGGESVDKSKCIGAVFTNRDLKINDPKGYSCTGRFAKIQQNLGGVISITTTPQMGVPIGECKTVMCQQALSGVKGTPMCTPAITTGGNTAMNSWARDLQGATAVPTALPNPTDVGGGTVSTGANSAAVPGTTSNLNDGISNLKNEISTQAANYGCGSGTRDMSSCNIRVSEQSLTAAGLKGTDCYDGRCSLSAGTALSQLNQIQAGQAVSPVGTFQANSGFVQATGLNANNISTLADPNGATKLTGSGTIPGQLANMSAADHQASLNALAGGLSGVGSQTTGFNSVSSSGARGSGSGGDSLSNLPVSSIFSSIGKFLGCIVSLGFYCKAN